MIPVAQPALIGHEREYVLDALAHGQLSAGPYVERFELTFAPLMGGVHGVACSNGTAALHLALLAAGIRPGDEVIVPDYTYVATANAVRYCGATPVLVDVNPHHWTVDAATVERAITPRTRAIIGVDLYGHPANWADLRTLADGREGCVLIDDAAEAHGAELQVLGGTRSPLHWADAATYSFYGNKLVTCGEGGMVVTNDLGLAERMRLYRGQGQSPGRRYWHPVVGFNYRLTELQAAVALGQVEHLRWHLGQHRLVAAQYRGALTGSPVRLQQESDHVKSAWWVVAVELPTGVPRENIELRLRAQGIDTRPGFTPLHRLPMYQVADGDRDFPVASALGDRILILPTFAQLTMDQIDQVATTLRRALQEG